MARSKKLISRYVAGLKAEVNVREVYNALNSLPKKTPETIVQAASNPMSHLHKYFEWNDSLAAHNYRLQQARTLVMSVAFEVDGQVYRQFESVVLDDERMYVPVEDIAQNQDLVDQVLRQALDEAHFFKQKHQRWADFFSGLFGEIDKAEEAYRRKYGKKEKGRSGSRVEARNSTDKKANRKNNNHRGVTASR